MLSSRGPMLGSIVVVATLGTAACETTSPGSCFTGADAEAASNVATRYDRFSDSTMVGYSSPWPNTDAMSVMVTDTVSPLRLMLAGFACPGRTRCRPSSVKVMFSQYAMNRRPLHGVETVRFLLNGAERLSFPTAYYATDEKGSGDHRAYEGVVGIDVSYDDFAPVACADSVEFQIGVVEGVLSAADLSSLRKMFSDVPLAELAVSKSQDGDQ